MLLRLRLEIHSPMLTLTLMRLLISRALERTCFVGFFLQSSRHDCIPFQVLGVNPIEGFDKIKQTYGRKLKDAQKSGDEATAALVCLTAPFLWTPVK